jgi:hypothetical protein
MRDLRERFGPPAHSALRYERRNPIRALVLMLLAVAALSAPAPASGEALPFDRVLPGTFETAQCERGSLELARCFLVEISGRVPGLGQTVVRERVFQSGDVDLDLCEPQVRHGTIVASRGTIEYVATGIDCPGSRELNGGYRAVVALWTATGGTGIFAGVTGSGQESVRPDGQRVFIHLHGTFEVPGATFDLAPPVIRGVPTGQTRRARGPAIVRYARPTAVDAVDGPVPVACTPRSGTRFGPGRTVVRCEAFDASGNTATARFTVFVRRGGR